MRRCSHIRSQPCRTTREATQLDLSKAQKWVKFTQIHYDRTNSEGAFSHKEVTTIFIPDVWNVVPSLDEYVKTWRVKALAAQRAERAKKAAEAEKEKDEEQKKLEEQKVRRRNGRGSPGKVLGRQTFLSVQPVGLE